MTEKVYLLCSRADGDGYVVLRASRDKSKILADVAKKNEEFDSNHRLAHDRQYFLEVHVLL